MNKIIKTLGFGYIGSSVVYSSIDGYKYGIKSADNTCFKKNNLNNTELFFERFCYGTIVFSSTMLYVMVSPIYFPYNVYKYKLDIE